jgi:hypothetical protein
VSVEDQNGHFQVVIRLWEGATGNDIRNATPFALEVNDRLVEWQGTALYCDAVELLNMYDRGWSYAGIAEYLNGTLSTYVIGYAEHTAQYRALAVGQPKIHHSDQGSSMPPRRISRSCRRPALR